MGMEIPDSLLWLEWIVGSDWPEGDETAMRRCAEAWREAGIEIDAVVDELTAAATKALANVRGEGAETFRRNWQGYVDVDPLVFPNLVQACEQLGQALDGGALEIEYAKYMFIALLIITAIEIIMLIQAAFATFGAAAAGIPAVQISAQLASRTIGQTLLKTLAKHIIMGVIEGVGLDLAVQGLQIALGNRNGVDWQKTGMAAVDGAIGGALSGGIGAGLGRTGLGDAVGDSVAQSVIKHTVKDAIAESASGVGSAVASAAITGEPLTGEALAKAATSGGFGGAVGGARDGLNLRLPDADVRVAGGDPPGDPGGDPPGDPGGDPAGDPSGGDPAGDPGGGGPTGGGPTGGGPSGADPSGGGNPGGGDPSGGGGGGDNGALPRGGGDNGALPRGGDPGGGGPYQTVGDNGPGGGTPQSAGDTGGGNRIAALLSGESGGGGGGGGSTLAGGGGTDTGGAGASPTGGGAPAAGTGPAGGGAPVGGAAAGGAPMAGAPMAGAPVAGAPAAGPAPGNAPAAGGPPGAATPGAGGRGGPGAPTTGQPGGTSRSDTPSTSTGNDAGPPPEGTGPRLQPDASAHAADGTTDPAAADGQDAPGAVGIFPMGGQPGGANVPGGGTGTPGNPGNRPADGGPRPVRDEPTTPTGIGMPEPTPETARTETGEPTRTTPPTTPETRPETGPPTPTSRPETGAGAPGTRPEAETSAPGPRPESEVGAPGARLESEVGAPGARLESEGDAPTSRSEAEAGASDARSGSEAGASASRPESETAAPGPRSESEPAAPGARSQGEAPSIAARLDGETGASGSRAEAETAAPGSRSEGEGPAPASRTDGEVGGDGRRDVDPLAEDAAPPDVYDELSGRHGRGTVDAAVDGVIQDFRGSWRNAYNQIATVDLASSRLFSAGDHEPINAALNSGDRAAAGPYAGQIRSHDGVLAALPPFEGQVLRTADLDPAQIARYREGATVREPGFVIGTLDPGGRPRGNAEFVIQSRTGRAVGPAIDPRTGAVHFPRGTAFEVTRVEDLGDGRTRIHMAEVDEARLPGDTQDGRGQASGTEPSGTRPRDTDGTRDDDGPARDRDADDRERPPADEDSPASEEPRGPRPSIDDLIPRTQAEAEARRAEILDALKQELERTYGPYTIRLDEESSTVQEGALFLRGGIYDGDQRVGHWGRDLRRERGDVLSAHHISQFITSESNKGRGFSNAFNHHLEGWYRESGVERVHLKATNDGRVVWARKGWDFAHETEADQFIGALRRETERLGEWLDTNVHNRDISDEQYERAEDDYAAARDLLRRADQNDFGSAGFPRAQEIAQLGYRPGMGRTDSWLGKQVMTTTDWHGVKHLGAPDRDGTGPGSDSARPADEAPAARRRRDEAAQGDEPTRHGRADDPAPDRQTDGSHAHPPARDVPPGLPPHLHDVWRSSVATEGGRTFHGTRDPGAPPPVRARIGNGYAFDAVGNRFGPVVGGQRLTPSDVADLVRADPAWNGRDLYYLVSDAGNGPRFTTEVAQRLGVRVIAPRGVVDFDAAGRPRSGDWSVVDRNGPAGNAPARQPARPADTGPSQARQPAHPADTGPSQARQHAHGAAPDAPGAARPPHGGAPQRGNGVQDLPPQAQRLLDETATRATGRPFPRTGYALPTILNGLENEYNSAWTLAGLNNENGRLPTAQRLRDIWANPNLTQQQRALLHHVLSSPDPDARIQAMGRSAQQWSSLYRALGTRPTVEALGGRPGPGPGAGPRADDTPLARSAGDDPAGGDDTAPSRDGDQDGAGEQPPEGLPAGLHDLWRSSTETPGGRAFYGPGEQPHRDAARRVPPDPNRFILDMHGDANGVRVGDRRLSVDEVADLIRNDPNWDRREIMLLSCETGAGDFARQLADRLKVPVTAPNRLAWSDRDGNVYASTSTSTDRDGRPIPDHPPNGAWTTFHHDGSEAPAGHDGNAPGHPHPATEPPPPHPANANMPHQQTDWDPPPVGGQRPERIVLNPGQRIADRQDLQPNRLYHVYERTASGANVLRTIAYTGPADADGHGRVTHVTTPPVDPNRTPPFDESRQYAPPFNPDANADFTSPAPGVTHRVDLGIGSPHLFEGVADDGRTPPATNFDPRDRPHDEVRGYDVDRQGPYSAQPDLPKNRRIAVYDSRGELHGIFWTNERGEIEHVRTWFGNNRIGFNPELGINLDHDVPRPNAHYMVEPRDRFATLDPADFDPIPRVRGGDLRDDGVHDLGGTFLYQTGDRGHTIAATGQPLYGMSPDQRHDMQKIAGYDGKAEYRNPLDRRTSPFNGGHIFPHEGLGPGEGINYFPQEGRTNQGSWQGDLPRPLTWRRMEEYLAQLDNRNIQIERFDFHPEPNDPRRTPVVVHARWTQVDNNYNPPVVTTHYRSFHNLTAQTRHLHGVFLPNPEPDLRPDPASPAVARAAGDDGPPPPDGGADRDLAPDLRDALDHFASNRMHAALLHPNADPGPGLDHLRLQRYTAQRLTDLNDGVMPGADDVARLLLRPNLAPIDGIVLRDLASDPAGAARLHQMAVDARRHDDLRAILGEKPTRDSFNAMRDRLDDALARPITEPGQVVRDLDDPGALRLAEGGMLGARDPRSLVGTVQTEPGYVSIPPHDPDSGDGPRSNYRLRLDVPEGAQGVRTADGGLYLPRGTRYEITGVEERGVDAAGRPIYEITATVLPSALPDHLHDTYRNSERVQSGRAMFAEGDGLRESSRRVPVDPSRFYLQAHADRQGLAFEGQRLSVDDVAAIIRRDPNWMGREVLLLACDSGAPPSAEGLPGGRPFAAQLAERLGVPVTAPDTYGWVGQDGSVQASTPQVEQNGQTYPAYPPDGRWITFQPDGTHRVVAQGPAPGHRPFGTGTSADSSPTPPDHSAAPTDGTPAGGTRGDGTPADAASTDGARADAGGRAPVTLRLRPDEPIAGRTDLEPNTTYRVVEPGAGGTDAVRTIARTGDRDATGRVPVTHAATPPVEPGRPVADPNGNIDLTGPEPGVTRRVDLGVGEPRTVRDDGHDTAGDGGERRTPDGLAPSEPQPGPPPGEPQPYQPNAGPTPGHAPAGLPPHVHDLARLVTADPELGRRLADHPNLRRNLDQLRLQDFAARRLAALNGGYLPRAADLHRILQDPNLPPADRFFLNDLASDLNTADQRLRQLRIDGMRYLELGRILGEQPTPEAVARRMGELDQSLGRRLPFPTRAVRDLGDPRALRLADGLLGNRDPRLLVGTVQTEPGASVAVRQAEGDVPPNYRLLLDVPPGSAGVWQRGSLYMPRGIRYQITSVVPRGLDAEGRPTYDITATVIPSALPDHLHGVWQGSSALPAGRTLNDPDDVAYAPTFNIPPSADRYVLVGHGSPNSMSAGRHTMLTPDDVAALIRNDPDWNGRVVVLYSCHTGSDAGQPPFAALVAQRLGVPVIAPSTLAWHDAAGNLYTTSAERQPDGSWTREWPPNGRWTTFQPDGTHFVASTGYAPGHRLPDPVYGVVPGPTPPPVVWDPPARSDRSPVGLRLGRDERIADRTDLVPNSVYHVWEPGPDGADVLRSIAYTGDRGPDGRVAVTHVTTPAPDPHRPVVDPNNNIDVTAPRGGVTYRVDLGTGQPHLFRGPDGADIPQPPRGAPQVPAGDRPDPGHTDEGHAVQDGTPPRASAPEPTTSPTPASTAADGPESTSSPTSGTTASDGPASANADGPESTGSPTSGTTASDGPASANADGPESMGSPTPEIATSDGPESAGSDEAESAGSDGGSGGPERVQVTRDEADFPRRLHDLLLRLVADQGPDPAAGPGVPTRLQNLLRELAANPRLERFLRSDSRVQAYLDHLQGERYLARNLAQLNQGYLGQSGPPRLTDLAELARRPDLTRLDRHALRAVLDDPEPAARYLRMLADAQLGEDLHAFFGSSRWDFTPLLDDLQRAVTEPLGEPGRTVHDLDDPGFLRLADGEALGDRDPHLLVGTIQTQRGVVSSALTDEPAAGGSSRFRVRLDVPEGVRGARTDDRLYLGDPRYRVTGVREIGRDEQGRPRYEITATAEPPVLTERNRRLYEASQGIHHGRMLLKPDDPYAVTMPTVRSDPHRYRFTAHGSPSTVGYGFTSIGAPGLAALIRQDPEWRGRPVTLDACDVGRDTLVDRIARLLGLAPPGPIAARLARELGVPVTGPNHTAYTDAAGRSYSTSRRYGLFGAPVMPPDGDWITFNPDGSRSVASHGYEPGFAVWDPPVGPGPAREPVAIRLGPDERVTDRTDLRPNTTYMVAQTGPDGVDTVRSFAYTGDGDAGGAARVTHVTTPLADPFGPVPDPNDNADFADPVPGVTYQVDLGVGEPHVFRAEDGADGQGDGDADGAAPPQRRAMSDEMIRRILDALDVRRMLDGAGDLGGPLRERLSESLPYHPDLARVLAGEGLRGEEAAVRESLLANPRTLYDLLSGPETDSPESAAGEPSSGDGGEPPAGDGAAGRNDGGDGDGDGDGSPAGKAPGPLHGLRSRQDEPWDQMCGTCGERRVTGSGPCRFGAECPFGDYPYKGDRLPRGGDPAEEEKAAREAAHAEAERRASTYGWYEEPTPGQGTGAGDAGPGAGDGVPPDLPAHLQDVYLDSMRTPAGRAFYGIDEPAMRDAALVVPSRSDRYTVDFHAGPEGPRAGGRTLSADDMAALIRNDPNWHGRDVVVNSRGGADSFEFRAQLSQSLGVSVLSSVDGDAGLSGAGTAGAEPAGAEPGGEGGGFVVYPYSAPAGTAAAAPAGNARTQGPARPGDRKPGAPEAPAESSPQGAPAAVQGAAAGETAPVPRPRAAAEWSDPAEYGGSALDRMYGELPQELRNAAWRYVTEAMPDAFFRLGTVDAAPHLDRMARSHRAVERLAGLNGGRMPASRAELLKIRERTDPRDGGHGLVDGLLTGPVRSLRGMLDQLWNDHLEWERFRGYLGEDPTADAFARRVAELDRALERPLPEPLRVVRPLPEMSYLVAADGRQLGPRNAAEHLTGTVQSDGTPTIARLAPPDGAPAAAGAPQGSRLVLSVPRGAGGLWLGGAGRPELLLPRGTQYMITKVARAGEAWVQLQDARRVRRAVYEAEAVVIPPGVPS
ncbi:hypothetical protein [Actinomadura sp. 21ATH]|uniref:WXG100-like domain-containing protein n=1 Tax=Actinomadura sp. 21ATH TaxID=1735444 RepID=UPI0035C25103